MEFKEIKEEIKALSPETLRTDSDNFFEAVFLKDGISKLNQVLKKFLLEPVWPRKNKLSAEIEEAIKEYGGVMPHQTLYCINQGESKIFAMLWPWQDKSHTTLKIFQK